MTYWRKDMKKLLVVLLACLLAVTTIGCAAKTEDPAAPATDGATGEPKSVTIATDTDLISMDTSLATDGTSFIALTLCMAGLAELDEKGTPIPDLATWTVSDDGLNYEFKIREDAKWSDGTPVTAHDFVYSWDRLTNPDTAADYAFLIETCYITNYEAADDTTFKVTMSQPCDFFLALCAFPSLFPLNQAYVESKGDQYGLSVDNMIYCGPYVMTEWNQNDHYTFKKNADYYNAENCPMDEINFRYIQGQSAVLEYESGNIDYVKLTSELIDTYANDEGFNKKLAGYLWYLSLYFGNEDIANENVRAAIFYSVDRETIADKVLKDGSIAAEGIIPCNFAFHNGVDYRETQGKQVDFNVDTAKEYYAKAVEELGHDVTLELLYEDSDVSKNVAAYLQKCMQDAGFTVEMKCEPKKTRLQDMQNGQYTVALHRWGPDYADPQTYIDLFTTNASNNYGKWTNADYDATVQEAEFGASAADSDARWNLMLEAEKILLGDYAVVPVYQNGETNLINPKLTGIQDHAGGVDNYRHMTLAD